MLKKNTMMQNASAALQAVLMKKDATEKEIQEAFEGLGNAVAATIQADYESAHGDQNILLQRGFRVLTAPEQKYYEQIIEAGKSDQPRQAYNGLLDGKVMPNTIIEDVYRNLTEEHPLLEKINFQSVEYLTRWIMNDHSAQNAVWGAVNAQITEEIKSAFRVIEMTQCKLSAYAVIEKDMLELGPVFLDNYIRTFLQEALAKGLEAAIISGDGNGKPIGMTRNVSKTVTVTAGSYPEKSAVSLNSFMPEDYGPVLAQMAVTEKWYEDSTGKAVAEATAVDSSTKQLKQGYTVHGGNVRTFDKVALICNQVDYLSKVMPATTAMNAAAQYVTNCFPFPTDVIRSSEVPTGKAILCLPEEYFMGLGHSSKEGTLEFSDDFKFLEDQRVFKIKMHGNGRPFDNTVALLVDISNLQAAYVFVKELTA